MYSAVRKENLNAHESALPGGSIFLQQRQVRHRGVVFAALIGEWAMRCERPIAGLLVSVEDSILITTDVLG
jgi:hypothetical protein